MYNSHTKKIHIYYMLNPCNYVLYTHNICTHFPDGVIERNVMFLISFYLLLFENYDALFYNMT